jgi:hypothetical protein
MFCAVSPTLWIASVARHFLCPISGTAGFPFAERLRDASAVVKILIDLILSC